MFRFFFSIDFAHVRPIGETRSDLLVVTALLIHFYPRVEILLILYIRGYVSIEQHLRPFSHGDCPNLSLQTADDASARDFRRGGGARELALVHAVYIVPAIFLFMIAVEGS